MREYMDLGPAPCMEVCAQCGAEGYAERARAEGRAYIGVIRRAFPTMPEGLALRLKSYPHDFGSYYEVSAVYDYTDEEAAEFAYMLERMAPQHWDEEARTELGLAAV